MPPKVKAKPKVKKPKARVGQKQKQTVIVNIGDLVKKKVVRKRKPKAKPTDTGFGTSKVGGGGGGAVGSFAQIVYPVVPQPKEAPLTADEKYYIKYLYANKPTQASNPLLLGAAENTQSNLLTESPPESPPTPTTMVPSRGRSRAQSVNPKMMKTQTKKREQPKAPPEELPISAESSVFGVFGPKSTDRTLGSLTSDEDLANMVSRGQPKQSLSQVEPSIMGSVRDMDKPEAETEDKKLTKSELETADRLEAEAQKAAEDVRARLGLVEDQPAPVGGIFSIKPKPKRSPKKTEEQKAAEEDARASKLAGKIGAGGAKKGDTIRMGFQK